MLKTHSIPRRSIACFRGVTKLLAVEVDISDNHSTKATPFSSQDDAKNWIAVRCAIGTGLLTIVAPKDASNVAISVCAYINGD